MGLLDIVIFRRDEFYCQLASLVWICTTMCSYYGVICHPYRLYLRRQGKREDFYLDIHEAKFWS